MIFRSKPLGSLFGNFVRNGVLLGAICISISGYGCADNKKHQPIVDRNAVYNPHPELFSRTIDEEPRIIEGNFPLMYGLYANNTNNASGYADMATILHELDFFETPSGFKFEGNDLYVRVKVNHPPRAKGLINGDYIGVVSPLNKSGIIDFSGMSDYSNRPLTTQEAFEHAGFFFNTQTFPTELDTQKPPAKIGSAFDPLNPANPAIERVNYGGGGYPANVQLPTGDVVEAELFIEVNGGRKVVVDLNQSQGDRSAIEHFRVQPFFDPATLDARYIDTTTRAAVDSVLFEIK